MTGREHIASGIGRSGSMFAWSMLITCFFLAFAIFFPALAIPLLGGFFVFGTISLVFACWPTFKAVWPYCCKRVSQLLGCDSQMNFILKGLPPTVKYCPFCGADFDSEMTEDNSAMLFVKKHRR